MKATRVQGFILFTLGKWFEEANRKIAGKPLEVSISKATFIGLVKKAEFARKQSRALYKNLEILEKKKLIVYKNHQEDLLILHYFFEILNIPISIIFCIYHLKTK